MLKWMFMLERRNLGTCRELFNLPWQRCAYSQLKFNLQRHSRACAD